MSPPVILGPDGRPVLGADRVRIAKQSAFNPLPHWTPERLSHQLTAFAQGNVRSLAWVMEWLEKHDDTLQTVVPKAKSAVSRHGYDVKIKRGIKPEQKGQAEDQRAVLEGFYDNIEVTHAIDEDESGKFRLLVQQVMDAHGKGYATHHIVWTPTPDGVRAQLIFVPLWFWEATEGRLRFLLSDAAIRGVDRSQLGGDTAWMISKGRGVMLACAIARMFKQLPLQNWLTYSDRHGMPAFIGRTTAAQGTAGWQMLCDAVGAIGSEYGAVINVGDMIDVLDLTAKGELPYEKLIDRMDRAMAMLWRGADLSTISRPDGVGSNPQQEESDELDADNAVWVQETIDRNLSRTVLDYHFGPGSPQLAELVLRTRIRNAIDQDIQAMTFARQNGVRLSKPWVLERLDLVEADEDEPAFGDGVPVAPPVPVNPDAPAKPAKPLDPAATATAVNSVIQQSLADAIGVESNMLAPVESALSALEARVHDGSITDAEFLQMAQQLAEKFPEFWDGSDVERLSGLMEGAMGGAALRGARDGIRDSAPTPKNKS